MKKSQKGFTLIEMLISFMVFLLIVFSLPLFLKILNEWTTPKSHVNPLEWQVFIQQSKIEIREASEIYIDDETLKLTKYNGEIVSYEMYDDKLRRRVNSRGHEILLQNVKSVTYKPEHNGVTIICYGEDNQQYSARISSLINIVVRSNEQ